jgi:hypothetical protein
MFEEAPQPVTSVINISSCNATDVQSIDDVIDDNDAVIALSPPDNSLSLLDKHVVTQAFKVMLQKDCLGNDMKRQLRSIQSMVMKQMERKKPRIQLSMENFCAVSKRTQQQTIEVLDSDHDDNTETIELFDNDNGIVALYFMLESFEQGNNIPVKVNFSKCFDELIQPGDGHCFFHCINCLLENPTGYQSIRNLVSDYLIHNSEEFVEFFEDGHIGVLARATEIRKNAYADEYEITIIEKVYKRPVIIYDKEGNLRRKPPSDVVVEYLLPVQPFFLCFVNNNHYNVLVLRQVEQFGNN